ncbi:endonuclease III [Eisenibacter elegans]|jgi:endonuclease-3|uniref:endonuclease III n=1 Tax=Eisenibacter elegans TaxID=997 RepID=UPI0004225560|nr:endonuclease III [Eisenibacter elegans]
MRRSDRYKALMAYFAENFPSAETELQYNSPFELLVAVILSAQCTDKRVNMVTPALFERYPDAHAMSKATFDELFPYIRSISYPNNKTKHLIGMAQRLIEVYGGEIPADVKALQTLPGVGRKTANVIVSVLYDQPAMAVDTHVFRVSKRLGLVNQNAKTPLEVEKTLIKHIPDSQIARAHHWLILHGRYVCTARNPQCDSCAISQYCRHYEKKQASQTLPK